MLKGQSSSIFGIETKLAFSNIMLVANPLVWYYTLLIFLQESVTKMSLNSSESTLVYCIHFFGLVFSALVGASLTKKIERTHFLTLWMMLGVMLSIALFAIGTPSILSISTLALLFGVFLGVGMPTCMGYYTDCIPVEKRGRVSGIVMLASGIGIFAFGDVAISNPLVLGATLAGWRLSSLIIFLMVKSSKKMEQKNVIPSYKLVISQQSFILYFIPWFMFSLVNYLSGLLQLNLVGTYAGILTLFQTVIMGIFAVLGGFLLDSVGRKRIAIAGFVMLGLGASVLGVFPESIFSWYFNAIVDGVAWGFLLVLFIVTIWGDLSHSASSDKYYAIGVLPFFASKFLDVTIGGYIAKLVPPYALFSFVAFFLFLAVLPLVYAPETLPEKQIKERELKSYIEKAKKAKEKYA
jgi:MFS family permease